MSTEVIATFIIWHDPINSNEMSDLGFSWGRYDRHGMTGTVPATHWVCCQLSTEALCACLLMLPVRDLGNHCADRKNVSSNLITTLGLDKELNLPRPPLCHPCVILCCWRSVDKKHFRQSTCVVMTLFYCSSRDSRQSHTSKHFSQQICNDQITQELMTLVLC